VKGKHVTIDEIKIGVIATIILDLAKKKGGKGVIDMKLDVDDTPLHDFISGD
jgi:hypothetical protein